jgi:hypothetical protein
MVRKTLFILIAGTNIRVFAGVKVTKPLLYFRSAYTPALIEYDG